MLHLYSTEAHAVQHAEPNKIHDLLVTLMSSLQQFEKLFQNFVSQSLLSAQTSVLQCS